MNGHATLTEWAKKWGVSRAALDDLARVSVAVGEGMATGANEGHVQARVRVEAAHKGLKLFRNNVGAGYMKDGSFIRWGLCNDSSALNEVVKSGDLIGFRPRVITVRDVGSLIAQFVSRECKPAGWTFKGTPRELAHLKWSTMVNAYGGDAKFTDGLGSFDDGP